jgi:hypothetical protein
MSTVTTPPVEAPTRTDTVLDETIVEAEARRLPVEPPAPVIVAAPSGGEGPRQERRLTRRRAARGGARAEVRRGDLGLGPDVAVALVDVSEDGVGIRTKVEVQVDDGVTVGLGRPGGGKLLVAQGIVRWCRPEPDGRFRVGLALRRRLTHADLMDLAR